MYVLKCGKVYFFGGVNNWTYIRDSVWTARIYTTDDKAEARKKCKHLRKIHTKYKKIMVEELIDPKKLQTITFAKIKYGVRTSTR